MGVILALALPGCGGGGGGGDPADVVTPVSVSAPPSTVRPTADEIVEAVQVVDTGVTNGQVIGCNTPGGQATGFHPDGCPPEHQEPIQDSVLYGSVSYGFVIENTSDQMLYNVPLVYRFYDEAGEVISEHATAFGDGDPTGDAETLPYLRPGERFGLGGMDYPGRPGVAEVRVEIGEPMRWTPEALETALLEQAGMVDGELTVTEVDVHPGEDGEPVATYTVRSTYGEPITAQPVYAVFYDADGRIVGGAHGWAQGPTIPPGGEASGEVPLDDPMEVPGIDPARTEIYIPGVRVVQR